MSFFRDFGKKSSDGFAELWLEYDFLKTTNVPTTYSLCRFYFYDVLAQMVVVKRGFTCFVVFCYLVPIALSIDEPAQIFEQSNHFQQWRPHFHKKPLGILSHASAACDSYSLRHRRKVTLPWGKAKLGCLASWLSFALPQGKLTFNLCRRL